MQLTEQSAAKVQAVIGAGLVITPWWTTAIQTTSLVASCIAAVCGAILGVHGVLRMWRGRKK